jgi:hypothetical protein
MSRQREARSSANGAARPARVLVAGVGGGVGTTTLATALSGVDRGVFTGRAVDVVVCRSTAESVTRAARAAQLVRIGSAAPPVLAVTAAGPARPDRALLARLRLLEPHAAAIVLLPYVSQWSSAAAPLDSLHAALRRAPEELPRALRGYLRAVAALSDALTSRRSPVPDPRPSSTPLRPSAVQKELRR